MSEPYWVPLGATGYVPQGALVTALPGSPVDGQEVVLTDSLTAPTYTWHLRYIAAKASNKWVFVGGAPAYAEVVASEALAVTTYSALTTPGPSIAVPVAGDYLVSIGFRQSASADGHYSFMSYDIGATPASDADLVQTLAIGAGNPSDTVTRTRKKSLPAVTLTAKYRCGGSASKSFADRWMILEPVAIGG